MSKREGALFLRRYMQIHHPWLQTRDGALRFCAFYLLARLFVWFAASRFKRCKTTLVGCECRSRNWQKFGLLMSRLHPGPLRVLLPDATVMRADGWNTQASRTIKFGNIRLHLRPGIWFLQPHLCGYWEEGDAIKLQVHIWNAELRISRYSVASEIKTAS